MATWQVVFYLVSSNKNLNYFELDLQDIENPFPEEKSWCKSIKQYGNLDSTCIEIDLYDNSRIGEISLRVDLRNISENQLKNICDFANKNNLLIEYENITFEASVSKFIKIFRDSDAYRFIQNPNKYFESVQ